MSEPTPSEIKALIQEQIRESNRRRDDDIQRWTKMEGAVQTISRRQDQTEREVTILKTAVQETSGAASETQGKVMGALGTVERRLNDQDKEIANVRRETAAQTPIIASTHETVVAFRAQLALLKWVAGGGSAVLIGLWWLFTHVNH